MQYKGSCHCGRIAFEAEGTVDSGLACNCSICARKGSLLWFIPGAQFRLLTPAEAVSTYTFHKHHISHRFCAHCGMHPYAEAPDQDGNPVVAVNLRCLEDFDLAAVPVNHYDGKAL